MEIPFGVEVEAESPLVVRKLWAFVTYIKTLCYVNIDNFISICEILIACGHTGLRRVLETDGARFSTYVDVEINQLN